MKQEIDFVKFSPTQNMTILVKTWYPQQDHARIAANLMSYDHVHAEQVGFIQQAISPHAEACLHMAGGEFCGNACMSLAVMLAIEKNIADMTAMPIQIETSGNHTPIQCIVTRKAGQYYCRVRMPVPEQIQYRTFHKDKIWQTTKLNYQDAIHFVIEVQTFSTTLQKEAESFIRILATEYDVSLIGLLLYDAQTGEMAPLIYVPALDSIVWERGCGSGTASIGAYLAWKHQKAIDCDIKQPGGTIRVTANYQHTIVEQVEIEGNVGLVAQGKAFVNV